MFCGFFRAFFSFLSVSAGGVFFLFFQCVMWCGQCEEFVAGVADCFVGSVGRETCLGMWGRF